LRRASRLEISCPAHASSINFGRNVKYGVGPLKTSTLCRLHHWGIGEASFLIDDPALRLDPAGPRLL
jgi:hypothetical protein